MSDAAITTIVSGVITIVGMVIGFLTMWVKLRGASKKIDSNTEMTRAGTNAAYQASYKTDALIDQMNGKLDGRIATIVKAHTEPIATALRLHAEQDDKNMGEIRQALVELRDNTKR